MPNEGSTVRDIYRHLKKMEEQSTEYRAFLDALKNLDDMLGELNTTDKYGALPKVNQKAYARLQELYAALGQAGETFLAAQAGSDAVKAQSKRLLTLASGDLRALNAYDPQGEPKSIQDIAREGRTITLDVGDQKLSTVGQMFSTRVPLTVNLPDGKKLEGVFTPKDEENYMERGERLLKKAIERAPTQEGKQMLQTVLDTFSKDNPALDDETRRKNFLSFIRRSVLQPEDPTKPERDDDHFYIGGEFVATLIGRFNKTTQKDVLKACGEDQLQELAEGIGDFVGKALTHNDEAGIEPDKRIDNRNAAMTTVSVLLGVPKLVCRSIPLKLRGADGKSVEGTIMDLAEGYDLNNLPPEAEKINGSSLSTPGMEWRKSVADLQVLDYICGNVDRHGANLFYQFSGDPPKLTGVQGIDNDCDFGTIVLKDGKGQKRLIGTASMNAVSESMYCKVMSLKPEQLKFALRGHELSEKELDAAAARLTEMQRALKMGVKDYEEHPTKSDDYLDIHEGYIRVVKDGDWGLIPRGHLENTRDMEANLFHKVDANVRKMRTKRKEQETMKDLNDARGHLTKAAIVNRASEEGVAQERDRVQALDAMLKKKTGIRGTSKNYEALRERLQEYQAYQDSLAQRLSDSRKKGEDDFVSYDDLETGQNYIRAIRDAADKYLTEKQAKLGKKSPNGYEKSRMDAVRTVLNFAADSIGYSDLETETAERNTREEVVKANQKEEKARESGPVMTL